MRRGPAAATPGELSAEKANAVSPKSSHRRVGAVAVASQHRAAALGSAVLAAGACGADPASARYEAAYPAFRSMIDAATASDARMNSREPAR